MRCDGISVSPLWHCSFSMTFKLDDCRVDICDGQNVKLKRLKTFKAVKRINKASNVTNVKHRNNPKILINKSQMEMIYNIYLTDYQSLQYSMNYEFIYFNH